MKARDVRIFDADSGNQLRTLTSETASPWFSPDGRMLVVAENARFTFFETQTWQPIHRIESIRFSGDGRYLVSGGGDQHLTHIWDLVSIRRSLREFGLDWDASESLAVDQPLKPIRLRLDLGEIANTDKRPVYAP